MTRPVSKSVGMYRRRWRNWILPSLAGLGGAGPMIGIYLGVLTFLQSPGHALEQLSQDRLWVGLVAVGFGLQIGLYARLRMVLQTAPGAALTAATGAGTGTSTVGMLACCAHRLTDLAPLLTLTGGSAFSSAAAFLTAWKIPIILLGLGANVIGILVTATTLRQRRGHLAKALASSATERVEAPDPAAWSATAPACH